MVTWNRAASHATIRMIEKTQLLLTASCVFAIPLAAAAAQVAASNAAPAPVARAISLSSPLDYQVFQRRTRLEGAVTVRGRISSAADRVEARLTGTSLAGPLGEKWQSLSLDRPSGAFHGNLPTRAGGFYSLEVRAISLGHPDAAAMVEHVAVGEVFVVSGQSNSTNYGEMPQTTQTRMVATFSGTAWRIADDPQPGVQDNSKKGSFIPAFGDALYRKYHVPIGIASVGHGSTSVRQWLPVGEPILKMPTMAKFVLRKADGSLMSDGTLFNGMMERIEQLGPHGFRALLWHQGESDADQTPAHQISPEEYGRMMERLIRASRRVVGWDFPWFVALVSYHPGAGEGSPPLRAAQRELWRSGVALEGPDTDTLKEAYRQNNGKGVHMNARGLQAHGALWAAQVEAYLNRILR